MERRTGALRLPLLHTLLTKLLLRKRSRVRIETEQDLSIAQRVLLLHGSALGLGLAARSAQRGLDFRRVDQPADVGVGDDVGGQGVVPLQRRGARGGAVDLVQRAKGRGRPHDEAAEMATGSELEEVERVDGAGLDAGDVAERLDQLLAVDFRVVNNEGSAALAVAAVPQLALARADLAGRLDLCQIVTRTEGLEHGDGGFSLGDGGALEGVGVDDQRYLGDLADTVAAGEKEGGGRRSGQGRGGSKSPEINKSPSV